MKNPLTACLGDAKKYAIITPIFVVGEVVLEIFIPFLMSKIIDNGIDLGDMDYIKRIGALLIITTIFSLVSGMLAGIFSAKASARFSRNLRQAEFERVQTFSFANIDHFSTAGLVTRMTTDITNLQMAFMMIIRIAVRAPVMMIAALGMTCFINPKMALIYVVIIPFLTIALQLIIRNAHPLFTKVFHTYDKLNEVVQENLLGIRVVKSFVREEKETDKFNQVSDEIYRLFSKAERLLAFNSPCMQFAVYTCILAISYFGAKSIVGGTLTTGQLMNLISYATQILMSLMMISMVFVMITMSKASAQRVSEVLTEESTIHNPQNPVMHVADGSVVFDHASFSYGGNKNALSDVSLTIPSGATVGIIGGTGSAKTTLVQLIARLYDTTEGRVLVGGVDVKDYDLQTLRDAVSMVLQKNVLFSGTIAENLRWGDADADMTQIRHAAKLACADEFVEKFPDQYETYIEQGGSNVSGGQKQRLCIARALLKQPKILILDDSTSAVDTRTDALIRQAFQTEIPNTTKIIIAQRISSVEQADLILVMDDGQIVDCGTHEALLSRCSIYQEVYQSQQKGDDTHA